MIKHYNKTALIWFLSYLAVLLIPFFLNGFIYSQSEKNIKKSFYENDSRTLEAVQVSFDRMFLTLPNTVRTVQVHPAMRELISLHRDCDETAYATNIFEIASFLSSLKLYNENLSDIYVYLPNLDIAVCDQYYYKAEKFFTSYYEDAIINYTDWYKNLNENGYADCTIVKNKNSGSDIYVNYSVPIYGKNLSAVVVIRINEVLFQNIVKSHHSNSDKNFYIVQDNSITMQAVSDDRYSPFMENGESCSVITKKSDINQWDYMMLVPEQVMSGNLKYLRNLLIINYILSFALVCIALAFLVKKNYSPIGNLFKTYSTLFARNENNNEYDILKSTLQDYMITKKQLETVEKQHSLIREKQLIEKLMTKAPDNEESARNELDQLDILFLSDYFSVVIFQYMDINGAQSTAGLEEIKMVFPMIVNDIIQKQFPDVCKIYFTEVSRETVGLINYGGSSISTWHEDISEILNETRSIVEKKYHFSFTTSISSMQCNITNIYELYTEALQTLRYCSILQNSDIVFFNDINMDSINYGHLSVKEGQLVNFIRIGDYTTASNVLDSMFEQLFLSSDIKYITISMFHIAYNIYNAVNASDMSEDNVGEGKETVRQLKQHFYQFIICRDTKQYKTLMYELLKLACEISCWQKESNQNKKIDNKIVASIKEYIKENYTSDALNVSAIGEYLQLTSAYVSSLFRKSENISILDYIAGYRIGEAKRLMENGENNITEIAIKVGFTNTRTFVRAFVKLEGVTPSQYKKLVNSQIEQ